MKWSSLLKEIKDKVGYPSQSQSQASATSSASGGSGFLPVVSANRELDATDLVDSPGYESAVSSPTSAWRGKHELEWEFKKFWEEFRSSSSEKEKETSLIMAVDAFCKLAKQHPNVAQLVNKLVEAHIFSFVIGRALVTDVEKLQMYSKGRPLTPVRTIKFFSEVTKAKGDINPGSNFLYAIEVLLSVPVDKQSLLDSGIFCCLIHILNALLNPNLLDQTSAEESETISVEKDDSGDALQVRHLEVEGRIVHIIKALASHPSAAQSSTEDNSLQILFDMVANGSLKVMPQFMAGLVPLHMIQLHRHAMQILGLLLVNDSGTAAKYIRRHHLIKVLLVAVKEFDPEKGDPSYTMGIVDLLLECVELSYRHEAGNIRLREDMHNAHGYQYFVQFALKLSSLQKNQAIHSSCSPIEDNSHPYGSTTEICTSISPVLSRLLDVLVNLAQIGPEESYPLNGANENSRTMVKDVEAVQMLQNIFLKVDSVALQAEVLNRMLKLFSTHIENYKICQELRTVSLFILNMATFPEILQEKILKILEYAVTVVNCIPEQELLSLCCLMQQPTSTSLK